VKYLLDTCVISELVAHRPNPAVLDWLNAADDEHLYLSVLTIGEIRRGIARLPASARRQQLDAWFRDDMLLHFDGRVLELSTEVMIRWGELVARLENEGRKLPAIDSLIAALALYHGCHLVTRNEKDFAGTGVEVVNPWR
jgi:tRNA(fMet)-specific endonuclease VapC